MCIGRLADKVWVGQGRALAAMANSGHFVAASFVYGDQQRKMGEFVQVGVSLRDWVERKLVQHLGIAPTEAYSFDFTRAHQLLQCATPFSEGAGEGEWEWGKSEVAKMRSRWPGAEYRMHYFQEDDNPNRARSRFNY